MVIKVGISPCIGFDYPKVSIKRENKTLKPESCNNISDARLKLAEKIVEKIQTILKIKSRQEVF
ncbi:MAG: hypothetical protein ACTSRP_14205 [Candidatus Helarchaeota archaeon]